MYIITYSCFKQFIALNIARPRFISAYKKTAPFVKALTIQQ